MKEKQRISSGTPTYLYTNLPVGACRPYYRSKPCWDTPKQPVIDVFGPEQHTNAERPNTKAHMGL